jgi:uncharacterized membrane protein
MRSSSISSTGLSSRTAAVLAYLAWWVTGLIFSIVERRDQYVRFHAAQSIAAFGAASVLIALLCGLTALSLSFFPAAFTFLIILVGVAWLASMVLWGIVMFRAGQGEMWRIPIAGELAESLLKTRFVSGP